MSDLIVPPQMQLSADVAARLDAAIGQDDLDAGVSSSFPVMSIRGAKWRVVEGGEEKPVYIPGTTDLAPAVRVVLLRSSPHVAKVYYADAYVEGSDMAPTCFSNDGIRPDPSAESPQSETCATCPHNVWGSKISPSGSKIKACADVRRMAILPAEDLSYPPILLRVPAASLNDLATYGRALKKHGVRYNAIVTKLSFDPDASYPKIMFRFERVLTPEEQQLVVAALDHTSLDDILGLSVHAGPPVALPAPAAADEFGIPADVGQQVAATAEYEALLAVAVSSGDDAPEKTSVRFTRMFSTYNARSARNPGSVAGSLMTKLGLSAASFLPSSTIARQSS